MFEYRITKYDPSQRNESGAYIGPSSWTCSSDIGNIFDGKVLTTEKYLRVESAYINAAIKLFEKSGLPYLRLTRVEMNEWQKEDLLALGPLYERAFEAINFTEDVIISLKDMRTVLQMIFRGFAWASLEWRNRFYVHIGWDFHMYVGTSKGEALDTTELYVDSNYPSPYSVKNLPPNILQIQRSKIGKNVIDDGYKINLPADHLERLKSIWGFSDEHPFIGYWRINPSYKDKIEKIVNQGFNFETYEYDLDTFDWHD